MSLVSVCKIFHIKLISPPRSLWLIRHQCFQNSVCRISCSPVSLCGWCSGECWAQIEWCDRSRKHAVICQQPFLFSLCCSRGPFFIGDISSSSRWSCFHLALFCIFLLLFCFVVCLVKTRWISSTSLLISQISTVLHVNTWPLDQLHNFHSDTTFTYLLTQMFLVQMMRNVFWV